MRIIATLTEAASIRRYLEGVGLPAEPPLIAPSPATPTATKPRLRRLKNSTADPPGIDHHAVATAGTTAICAQESLLRPSRTPFPLHPRS